MAKPEIYKTLLQLNSLFQRLLLQMLGYSDALAAYAAYEAAVAAGTWDAEDTPPLNPWAIVRVSWPTDGQPAWAVGDDRVFIQTTGSPDPYSQPVHRIYKRILDEEGELDQTKADEYQGITRVNNVQFIFYGPNSFDWARLAIDRIFRQENHDTLAREHIYLIPADIVPRRIPELWAGQWYERTDLNLRFNELTVRIEERPFIDIAEIAVTPDYPDETVPADVEPITIVH